VVESIPAATPCKTSMAAKQGHKAESTNVGLHTPGHLLDAEPDTLAGPWLAALSALACSNSDARTIGVEQCEELLRLDSTTDRGVVGMCAGRKRGDHPFMSVP
jgi:hypothetical protein